MGGHTGMVLGKSLKDLLKNIEVASEQIEQTFGLYFERAEIERDGEEFKAAVRWSK